VIGCQKKNLVKTSLGERPNSWSTASGEAEKRFTMWTTTFTSMIQLTAVFHDAPGLDGRYS
jgi:hypothetical protein